MATRKLPKRSSRRSSCPVSTTLDLVGDRWSLLLVRDIGLFDKHRNKDFQQGAEGIPSNILASRLKQLAADGLIEKRLYQEHPPRHEYHLTEAGRALLPVVRAMALWADEHVAGVRLPEGVRK
jgi:DNA-binding HxlR family transcriptional regulator